MSTYGYEYDTTPRLDAFAASASVFEPGIANATWSLPSHASLLTGLLPHQHGAHAVLRATSPLPSGGQESDASAQGRAMGSFSFAQRPLGAEHETLAELLASHGYSTAAIVANFGWVSEFFGLLQGFDYVDNRPMNLFNWEPVAAPYLRRLGWERLNNHYILLNKSAFFAGSIVEHVREWEGQRPPAPFFLLLNFMDAHAPFRASLMTDGFPGRLPDLDATGDAQSYSMARYDRSIAYLDRQVGELFEFLRSRGLFDDSLIIVTSDHGENFDENRPAAHGADLLQATVAVPLIIKLPNQREGSRPGRVGQLIDVVPTVREVLGTRGGGGDVRQSDGAKPTRGCCRELLFRVVRRLRGGVRGDRGRDVGGVPVALGVVRGAMKACAFGLRCSAAVRPRGRPEGACRCQRRVSGRICKAGAATQRAAPRDGVHYGTFSVGRLACPTGRLSTGFAASGTCDSRSREGRRFSGGLSFLSSPDPVDECRGGGRQGDCQGNACCGRQRFLRSWRMSR